MGNKETLETSHHDWVFRKEAFAYSKQSIVGALSGIEPIAPNFYPVATDLYNWLNRIEKNMKVLLEKPKDPEFFIFEPYINNPFSFNASTLANMTAQAINESLALARIPETLTPLNAEILHIRRYNELVMNCTRTCEALIKQCLYCSSIPLKEYEDVSLGGLLIKNCPTCKKPKPSHYMSLLGSLAHRYKLCRHFDCAIPALRELNKERKNTAAHAQTSKINIRSSDDSMESLKTKIQELIMKFTHILDHLSSLETLILDELEFSINSNDYTLFSKYTYYSDKIELGPF